MEMSQQDLYYHIIIATSFLFRYYKAMFSNGFLLFYLSLNLYHVRDCVEETYRPERLIKGILVDFLDYEIEARRSLWFV